MKRSALVLSLSLVFASGLVVGGLGYRLYYTGTTARATSRQLTPEQWRERYVKTLNKRLKLTADQRVKLDTILDQTKENFEALENQWREKSRPKQHEIWAQQVAAIKAILRPEQVAEYEKLREERAARRRKHKKESKSPSGSRHIHPPH